MIGHYSLRCFVHNPSLSAPQLRQQDSSLCRSPHQSDPPSRILSDPHYGSVIRSFAHGSTALLCEKSVSGGAKREADYELPPFAIKLGGCLAVIDGARQLCPEHAVTAVTVPTLRPAVLRCRYHTQLHEPAGCLAPAPAISTSSGVPSHHLNEDVRGLGSRRKVRPNHDYAAAILGDLGRFQGLGLRFMVRETWVGAKQQVSVQKKRKSGMETRLPYTFRAVCPQGGTYAPLYTGTKRDPRIRICPWHCLREWKALESRSQLQPPWLGLQRYRCGPPAGQILHLPCRHQHARCRGRRDRQAQ